MHGRGHAALAAASALIMAQGAATGASAVDGVIEINQARALAGGVTASDTPGWPVTIGASGSYRLTSDLVIPGGASGSVAIEVTVSTVSIDLNGFQILCGGPSCFEGSSGIIASSSVGSVSVSNGSINEMFTDAIIMTGSRNYVDGVRVVSFDADGSITLGSYCRLTNSSLGNGQDGGSVGDNCLVRNVFAEGTNGDPLGGGNNVTVIDSVFRASETQGLALGDHASVVNVTSSGHLSGPGIRVGAHSLVKNSRAIGNFEAGIEAVGGTLTGNVASDNFGPGIEVSGSATVVSNTANGNLDAGIQVGSSSTVRSNTAVGNSSEGLVATAGTGYGSNVFNGNNGGNANPQVSGGTEIGQNICGGDTTCP